MASIIYMFHAIGVVTDEDWADPYYSCSDDKFRALLKYLGRVSSIKDVINNNDLSTQIFTFDDGHISNYQAAKYMYDNNYGTADFFINPDKVGDPFYMNWEQIVELNEWGMSIQSHGLDHKFLSECDDIELHRQLLLSKNVIEDIVKTKVTIIAPPGGRFDNRVIELSQSCGYLYMANSEPGSLRRLTKFILPRMAVLNKYSAEDLLNMNSVFSSINLINKFKYLVLSITKKILGNVRYEKIRWKILGYKK